MRTAALATVLSLLTAVGTLADWDTNPSFELPYTSGWLSYNWQHTSNSDDFAHTGDFSLKIETDDIAEDPVPGGNLPSYTVVDSPHNAAIPGIEYTATGMYYLPADLKDHERIGLGLFWLKLNDDGTALEHSEIDVGSWSIVYGPESATVPSFPTGDEVVGAWTQISVTGTAPADAEFMQVAIEIAGDGSILYFDDINVIPEPASILLMGIGLTIVGMVRRKQR